MLNYNSQTTCSSSASLRDRYQFLMTLGGVVRMESLYLTDIFDLCDLFITTEQNKEPDPYNILILRVGAGKTKKSCVWKAHASY